MLRRFSAENQNLLCECFLYFLGMTEFCFMCFVFIHRSWHAVLQQYDHGGNQIKPSEWNLTEPQLTTSRKWFILNFISLFYPVSALKLITITCFLLFPGLFFLLSLYQWFFWGIFLDHCTQTWISIFLCMCNTIDLISFLFCYSDSTDFI